LLGVRPLLIKVTIPKLSQLYDQLPRSLEFLPPTIQLFSSRSGSHHELEQHIPRPLRGWLAKGVKQNWSYAYQETKALSRNDVFHVMYFKSNNHAIGGHLVDLEFPAVF
jgi:hypothetical protein